MQAFCQGDKTQFNIFMIYKNSFIKREPLVFHCFQRKGYSLFACLGREVVISVLSVSTLSSATAHGLSAKPLTPDTVATMDRELTLGEVSITGSRAPLTRNQAARMVTVLDSEAIAAAPVQSLNDLLKYAAGVDVRQRGPIGAQTDISLRGGNYEQITILLNGVSICDPQTGHNTFDLPVDISDIERIEVLEGPAGRIYATSSLLGAINIVTKSAAISSIDARIEGGSYGYLSTGARANIANGHWNNQLSAGYTRSDGYSRNKAGSLNADYKTGKSFYQGRYTDNDINVSWYAGLSVKDYGSNTFYSSKYDDQFEHTFKTFTSIQAENRHGFFHLRPTIYWNHTGDRFELCRGTEETVKFNYHRTDVYGLNLNSYFDWIAGRTAIGAELRNEDLVSTNLGEELSTPRHIHGTERYYTNGLNRTNISFVAEHNILLKRFTLSAGIVAVKNSWSEMNMKVYPGMDASYRIGNDWKIFASYNSSLRMPSATELYYSVGGHKADKRLKPEELSAVEGGMKFAHGGVQASTSVYYNHYKNMIDWIRHTADGADAPWESVNFTKVNAIGVQASLSLDFQQLIPTQRRLRSFKVAYNYISQKKSEAEGIESKYSLEYLRHKLVAGIGLNLWHSLDLNVNYRFQERIGNYTDTDGQTQIYQPYGILDARLSWSEHTYNIYVEANNITDKTYIDYGNVAQPGVWIMAGVTVNFDL